jgi:DNA-binding transcriptional MerR regulator
VCGLEDLKDDVKMPPKQLAEILGVSTSTLSKMTKDFNIETLWTQQDKKGQRRYTKDNVQDLLLIRQYIEVDGLGWEDAKKRFEGRSPEFLVDETKTKSSKEYDELKQLFLEGRQEQEAFFKAVLQRMDQVVEDAVKRATQPLIEEKEFYKQKYLESNDRAEKLETVVKIEMNNVKEELSEQMQQQIKEYKENQNILIAETAKSLLEDRRQRVVNEEPKQVSLWQRLFGKGS